MDEEDEETLRPLLGDVETEEGKENQRKKAYDDAQKALDEKIT
jgi:hypothetical protein